MEVLATQQGHQSQGPLEQRHHVYAFKKIVWEDEAACVRKKCKQNIMQNAMGTCMSAQLQNANDTRQQAYNTAIITQLDWKMQPLLIHKVG